MNKDTMTQIHTQFEKAARVYCEKSGIDPDERVLMSGPRPKIAGIPAPIVKVERWKLIAEELFDFSLRIVALREAKEAPKVLTS